jgi:hypothetical protein
MTTSDREGIDPLMCVSPKRKIFQASGGQPKRRIRACMKQVVGGIFTGLNDDHESHELEWDIINSLVDGSRRCAKDPIKTEAFQDTRLAATAQQIVDKLRVLIGDQVTRYMDAFAKKLFVVDLAYGLLTNHCQRFCANILDFRVFGSFLATTRSCRIHVPTNPLYLVSFVCPPGSYDSPRPIRPKTKTLHPNGLTEEYILRFRQYGHHEESDMIDKLMEYWRDWGNFGGPLYRHQILFPWDCTEAYRREFAGFEGKCNDCSIAKHVWSFPFDAWSMIQLHIYKERGLYSPSCNGEKVLSGAEWIRNRLAVLAALEALNSVAVAMARTKSFRATCRWNRERKAMTPDIASRLDRLKLSGIHRAQPQSHFFEQGKYHDCTLAEWSLLSREDQIKEYERLRDYRADVLNDIPPRPQRRRARNRLPHSNDSQPDTGSLGGHRHRHGSNHHSEESRDPDTDEPSDIDEEEYEEYEDIEEAEFEDGGGLLPTTFGADPPRSDGDYPGHHSDTEAGTPLLPNGFGQDGDKYYDHDRGAGPCDYDVDKDWINDFSNRPSDDCRRSIDGNPRGDHHEQSSAWRSGQESETTNMLESTADDDSRGRAIRILEMLSSAIPRSVINPTDINPDTDWYTSYRTDNDNNNSYDWLTSPQTDNDNNNSYDWFTSLLTNDSNSYDWFTSSQTNNNDDFYGGGFGGNNYYSSGNGNSDDGCHLM